MAAYRGEANRRACGLLTLVYVPVAVLGWLGTGPILPGSSNGAGMIRPLFPYSAVATCAGTTVLLAASLINFRKRKAGNRKMAEGNPSPAIPSVCRFLPAEARRSALKRARLLGNAPPPAPARKGGPVR